MYSVLSPMLNSICTFIRLIQFTFTMPDVSVETLSHPDVFVVVETALLEDGNDQNFSSQLPF